jgi:hypothetical protein
LGSITDSIFSDKIRNGSMDKEIKIKKQEDKQNVKIRAVPKFGLH